MSLQAGIEDLLHISEIAHGSIKNINDHLQIGQQIKVKVIETDDNGHVWLSIKELVSSKPEPAEVQAEQVAQLKQPELGMIYEGKGKVIETDDSARV